MPIRVTTQASTDKYATSFVDGDLAAGVLTISHNLATKFLVVEVYDNNDKAVTPDEVTATDTNTVKVDLSSFGTIGGTWNVVVAG